MVGPRLCHSGQEVGEAIPRDQLVVTSVAWKARAAPAVDVEHLDRATHALATAPPVVTHRLVAQVATTKALRAGRPQHRRAIAAGSGRARYLPLIEVSAAFIAGEYVGRDVINMRMADSAPMHDAGKVLAALAHIAPRVVVPPGPHKRVLTLPVVMAGARQAECPSAFRQSFSPSTRPQTPAADARRR